MTTFTQGYKNFSILILQLHESKVKTWSEDPSNLELATACRMLMDAGKQAQQGEK